LFQAGRGAPDLTRIKTMTASRRMNIIPPKTKAARPGFADRFGGLVVLALLAALTVGVYAYGDPHGFNRFLTKAERVLGL
jgi:hypothetical protein